MTAEVSSAAKQHLSHTQVDMFLRCPRQWAYRYLDGLKIPPSGAMMQSNAWHQAVAANYRQKQESDTDMPLGDVQDIFAARFDALTQNEIRYDEGQSAGSLKDEGVEVVEAHHEVIAPRVHPLLVEERFEIDIAPDVPYSLVGIWDLVERDGTIADNKCYGKTPSQRDIDKSLQLTAYSMALRRVHDTERGLRIDAVVRTKKKKAIQLNTTRDDAAIAWYTELLKQIARAVQAGVFYPNPSGWWCGERFCGYWHKCHGRG